jgi:hypothetical protein
LQVQRPELVDADYSAAGGWAVVKVEYAARILVSALQVG